MYKILFMDPSPMDVLYYSNYCKPSQQVLQYIVKNNLTDKLSCICIDKRTRDVNNNHLYVTLENGRKVVLPPGVHSVPTLLCVTQNHTILTGSETIVDALGRMFAGSGGGGRSVGHPNTMGSGPGASNETEPMSFQLGQETGIFSEKFTNFHLSPDVLSAKGAGPERSLYNYVSVDSQIVINTPEERYKPDKVSADVTVDVLQQQRMLEGAPRMAPSY